jgi:subtilisin family serine protease
MTAADAARIVAGSGCEVIRPLAYAPGHYLVGVVGRDKSTPSTSNLAPDLEIAASLRAGGALSADLNYLRFPKQTAPAGQKITPNDAQYGKQWHYDLIRMPEAWNIQAGKRQIKVGVIDSGVQVDHPDFKTVSGLSRVVQQDFHTAEPSTGDTMGHGTHVAGTIGASTNNTEGVAGIAGWERQGLDVKIISGRVFGSSGGTTSAEIITAVRWLITQNVDVANFSLGGYGTSTTEEAAFRDLYNGNTVVVAAAGNDSTDNDVNPHYPSDYPFVINVTSVGPNRKLSTFSNFAGNKKKIAAPGGALNGNPLDDVLSTIPGSKYDAFAGTSMASPHVAGVAALLISAGCPIANVYDALASTAQAAADGPDVKKYGPGILDAYSAVLPFADPDPSVELVGGNGVDRGTTYFHQAPLSVTMSGVSKIVASGAVAPAINEGDVTVEIQTVGRNPSTLKTYVGGRSGSGHFDIPTLGQNDIKGKTFTVQVPRDPAESVNLGAGQYRIVVKVAGVEKNIQFITVVDKVLPRGRSMVAVPYKLNGIASGTPERALLGLAPSFSVARYNPLRASGEQEYSTYADGVINVAMVGVNGPFAARLVTSGTPITFEQSNPSASISPIGNGYWLNIDRPTVLDTTQLPTPGVSASSPLAVDSVGIKVYAGNGGWNMIGAPFLFPVDWNAVSVVADGVAYSLGDAVQLGYISPVLVSYINGDYSYSVAPSGRLEPFQGYWVRTYRDVTLVVPPSASQGAGRAAMGNLQYGLKIGASVKGDRDGENVIAVAQSGKSGNDKFDVTKPPSAGGDVYVRIMDEQSGGNRSLAYDVRSADTSRKTWNVAVSAMKDNEMVTLSWNKLGNNGRSVRWTIVDLSTGQRMSGGDKSQLQFVSGAAGSTRKFQFIADPTGASGPLAVTGIRTVPSRATGGVTVRFSTTKDASTTAVITTVTGKVISTALGVTRAANGGDVTMHWDGKAADGSAVPAGPYRLEIKVVGGDNEQVVVHRMVQVVR